MTTIAHVTSDSATMLRRNLIHGIRYPALLVFLIGAPVVFLLLFVYVFGGTLGAGLPGVTGGGTADYLAYVVPGILLITIGGGVPQNAALSVAMDMKEGIVARFRTMDISRTAVLAGHVYGSVIQGLVAGVVVTGVALLLGLRPTAGPLEWLGVVGVLTIIAIALSWLGVAMGMASNSVENASNYPTIIMLLPLLGSGFVPTASMPTWLQGFAEYQPFTAFIETVRGLLFGTEIGNYWWLTLGWSIVITIVGYLWARGLYLRRSLG